MPMHSRDESGPRVHVLIPTHLPRYLDVVLAALGRQSHVPDRVIVSCDTDRDDIGKVIERSASAYGLSISWVRRAHMNGERLCQVRNNGVRALAELEGIDWSVTTDLQTPNPENAQHRLITLDGDMVSPPDLVASHAHMHAQGTARPPLIYAYRVGVERGLSESLTGDELFELGVQQSGLVIDATAQARLQQRDRRYRKHLLLRRWKLGPAHKPKLLGGHYSCSLDTYLRLNGFDELYQGWGFKDDEFAYRAARIGDPVQVAVAAIPAFHLWHTTRQADVPMRELPTAKRFEQRADLPLACEHGVRNTLLQAQIEVTNFE